MRPLKRNKFNLSHEHLGTYEMGPIYPNLLLETVPGDTFECVTESFSRFDAMTSATMSRIDKFQYYVYVPKRLVFADYYEKYRFGGKDGTDTTVPPYMNAPSTTGYAVGSLADHFGLPTGVPDFKHSAMPFRAYELFLNNWILNDHLDTFYDVLTTPGQDTTTNTSLVNKKWEKDRFTSCLPSPQLTGSPSYLPLGTSAPVITSGTEHYSGAHAAMRLRPADGTTSVSGNHNLYTNGTSGQIIGDYGSASYQPASDQKSVYPSNLYADMSKAAEVSIPQLRTAIVVQQFLERLNRSGTRPVETVLSTFGVRIPDYRLDRSEFLGGSRTPVVITPVEQTSESATTPQGTLTGRGFAAGTTGFRYHCLEDGYIMGFVCYIPRTVYSQGIDKLWSRETRYDEFLPDFQAIGDQEVKNQEIYAQAPTVLDTDNKPMNGKTFGYEDRYNEFRHIPSKLHGQFRPGASLNDHTLGRQFNSLPQLNSSFVTADPSTRIFAVTSGVDHIEAQFYHHIRAYRPLTRFGNPGLNKV